jgi:hypothetical protein
MPIPSKIHGIPPDATEHGVDSTPDPNILMPLFNLLFELILKLLRPRSHVRIVLGKPKTPSNASGYSSYGAIMAHFKRFILVY